MSNRLEKQVLAKLSRAEMPSRFIGILTPSEYGEMVEYGFIRENPDNLENLCETLTERMQPRINRGRLRDALNIHGCYDQPTFLRLGKKRPPLEPAEMLASLPARPDVTHSLPV